MEEKEDGKLNISAFYTAGNVESSEYRMEYNAKRDRAKYDDVKKRKEFKNEVYGDKKTIEDPYTGKILHKDGKAAFNKYGEKYVNEHKSQTDHTIPLEKVVNDNKNNTFLSDEDIREIANIKENYKEINAKLNQSKSSKSNIQTAKKNNVGKQQKKKMTEEQIKAQAAVDKKTAEVTIKKANQIGLDAAKSGAMMGAGISTAQNIKAVIDGQEDIPEAILNVGVDTAKAAATSYGTSIAVKSAEGVVKQMGDQIADKTKNTALEVIGEKLSSKLITLDAGVIGQAATITCEVGKSVQRYLKGELTPEQLIDELGEKGTSMASSISCGIVGSEIGLLVGGSVRIGMFVGGIVGNMVGYLIGSTVYRNVQDYFNKIGSYEANIARYNQMAEQIAIYRENLEKELDEINVQNRNIIKKAFEGMAESIINDDSEKFTESLDQVCNVYGKNVQFKTQTEFEEFWNNPDLMLEI